MTDLKHAIDDILACANNWRTAHDHEVPAYPEWVAAEQAIRALPELLIVCQRYTQSQPCNCLSVKAVHGDDSVRCDSCFARAAFALVTKGTR